MSPEQAEAKPADARSDIFSFGVVLYEMLSGRRAFPGDSAIATMAAIVRDEPKPLDVPAEVARVVARCLRKSPAERFQTAAELRVALAASTLSKPEETSSSIAVLAFANLSADRENEYFSDGLAEDILNALSQVAALNVAARTSSFSFKGKAVEIGECGPSERKQRTPGKRAARRQPGS
jgi:serine/threonine protein kinase